MSDTVFRQVLEGNLATVGVEVHTIVCCSISVGRKGVVSTAGIVAGTLAGIGSEEHAAGIDHALSKLFVVFHLQDEVFRGIGIG